VWGGGLEEGAGRERAWGREASPGTQTTRYIPPPNAAPAPCRRAAPAAVKGRVSLRAHMVGFVVGLWRGGEAQVDAGGGDPVGVGGRR